MIEVGGKKKSSKGKSSLTAEVRKPSAAGPCATISGLHLVRSRVSAEKTFYEGDYFLMGKEGGRSVDPSLETKDVVGAIRWPQWGGLVGAGGS